jgi:hypothetical protein
MWWADGIVVICELKLSFNLELVLQGVERSAACEEIWLAVRTTLRRSSRERDPRVRKLCRLLGFGLLGISASGHVELLVVPGAWRPRRNLKQRSKLVSEHQRRLGDPVSGGSTRAPIMTAYRQQALVCAALLRDGPRPTRDLRPAIPNASKILLHNVYGWFMRTARGIYNLTDAGRAALVRWPPPVATQNHAALRPQDSAQRQRVSQRIENSRIERRASFHSQTNAHQRFWLLVQFVARIPHFMRAARSGSIATHRGSH